MFVIYPYKLGSKSAKDFRNSLSAALETRIKLVKPNGNYRPRRHHIVINWGASLEPTWNFPQRCFNRPEAVLRASNKISAFQAFNNSNIDCVAWTTNKEEAEQWIQQNEIVVARAKVSGHAGQGISLHGKEFTTPLPNVPLYTKYKKKKREYRVHVLNGTIIDITQKKKRTTANRTETFNTYIRNIGTNWIFSRTDLVISNALKDIAIQAVQSLGLDFGAVDIIYNEKENKYYILEVNTAPGLSGTTLTKYTEAFLNVR